MSDTERALAARKDAIVAGWLARTLETYPERTRGFLVREQDGFRNPVGHTLREALPALFDEIVGAMDPGRLRDLLDGIVRIRAVQDFTAGEAVAFVFLLKKAIREEMGEGAELAALEGRIDQVALLAFDVFARCRDHMREIKANEAARRTALLDRMRGRP